VDSPRKIFQTLKTAKKILIPFHLRPDGDMIGSALAIYHLLKDLGKDITLVSTDPIPEIYFFLPSVKRIKNIDPANLNLSKFDLILILDGEASSHFSKKQLNFPPQTILVNIDHHTNNHGFCDLNYVTPNAAAATEVIYDLIKYWRTKITPEIATCLLLGIYTDTGSFLYPPTSAKSFSAAANLIRKGADRTKIVENSFRSWPQKVLKIWTYVLSNTKIREGIAYSQIPFKELHHLNFTANNLSEARSFATSNLLMGVKNIRIALLFTEESPKHIRVSLRSRGNLDISKIAERMGGGGHKNAATFNYTGPLKEVMTKTLQAASVI